MDIIAAQRAAVRRFKREAMDILKLHYAGVDQFDAWLNDAERRVLRAVVNGMLEDEIYPAAGTVTVKPYWRVKR